METGSPPSVCYPLKETSMLSEELKELMQMNISMIHELSLIINFEAHQQKADTVPMVRLEKNKCNFTE